MSEGLTAGTTARSLTVRNLGTATEINQFKAPFNIPVKGHGADTLY
jgi:hypothetical protein